MFIGFVRRDFLRAMDFNVGTYPTYTIVFSLKKRKIYKKYRYTVWNVYGYMCLSILHVREGYNNNSIWEKNNLHCPLQITFRPKIVECNLITIF